jgi:predicted secreted hydrolase
MRAPHTTELPGMPAAPRLPATPRARPAAVRPWQSALRAWLAIAIVLSIAGCGGAPILANEPLAFPSPVPPTAAPPRPADPIPVELPRDDGPHDRLTEWWYYTGHLTAADGRRFGFEAVVFRAERGAVPAAWASHLALTDEAGRRFLYAQRSEIGTQVDHSPRDAAGTPTGFDLQVSGLSPALIAAGAPPAATTPWRLAGAAGMDRIEAALSPEEAAAAGAPFGLALDLRALKPAALHDGDGFVDFGPAGTSYYYSRTRLAAEGELQLDGERLAVEGIAWFDHQWGDFVSVGGGGWDWFAINLDDGTDVTVSVVRDEDGLRVLSYGTVVDANGQVTHLDEDDIDVTAHSQWESPRTGRVWPSQWTIAVGDLFVSLRPTLLDQELDTRATTGVVYWEGSQVVSAARPLVSDEQIGGEAYVEITRYGAPGS